MLPAVSGQVGTNLVATYKALGGGWQIRQGQDVISEENRAEMTERTNWGGVLEPAETQLSVDSADQSDWRSPVW